MGLIVDTNYKAAIPKNISYYIQRSWMILNYMLKKINKLVKMTREFSNDFRISSGLDRKH